MLRCARLETRARRGERGAVVRVDRAEATNWQGALATPSGLAKAPRRCERQGDSTSPWRDRTGAFVARTTTRGLMPPQRSRVRSWHACVIASMPLKGGAGAT